MSATLTWACSGNGTKTGTGNANLLDDLDTLITSKSGDATFFWEKAGKSNSGTPRYLLLRRKDGSAGRIALVIFDSAPANNNSAILDATPASNNLLGIWFPSGTGTTLSNLTAASGTLCGTDTGVVKAQSIGIAISTMYQALYQPVVFDCAEGLLFYFNDPASSSGGAMLAAGALVVDGSDVAYDCVLGNSTLNTFGTTTGWTWLASFPNAGLQNAVVRSNYGAANRPFWPGWTPNGAWLNVAISSTDLLTDTSLNKAWFPPIQLLAGVNSSGSPVKGEGFAIKLRQIGFGPGTAGPLTVYNTTGPVVAARQICNRTAGANGHPWVTNFKI